MKQTFRIGILTLAAMTAAADMRGLNPDPLPEWAVTYKPGPRAPGRDWPQEAGQASVCLWKGDRLAAFSLTIDDNCAPDHPFWMEMGNEFGFRFTWFVITERVGTGGPWGTWAGFRKLHEMGHDIQSHTVSHLHGEYDIETEYRESKAKIEKEIPGHRALTLAYPGGRHTVQNDPLVAAKYYLGARGVVGFVTPAIRPPYMRTGSQGGGIFTGERSTMESFFDPQHRNYRGWHIALFHQAKEESRPYIRKNLARVKEREADIWVGTFTEVVRYARQRDTAKVHADERGPARIVFTLTDELDDTIFDAPLTVKVRLPPSWKSARAIQGGQPVPCAVVEHESAHFALVDAVPDRGAVTLTP
jgi:peptidoglycan/xylan/chitin deacetylase (PgdA/CDA1 family)